MDTQITVIQGPSILDLLGVYPGLLAAAAMVLGVASIAIRRRRLNLAAGLCILAISLLGLGATAWRLFRFNGLMPENGGADPSQWMRDFGASWMAAGVVLPACGIGLLFLAVACFLTKASTERI